MLLLLGCSHPTPNPVQAGADSAARVDSGSPDSGDRADSGEPSDSAPDDGFVGEVLDPPLDPPEFAVLDQAGVTRTAADLAGHPTVLWFFREAEGST